MIMTLRRMTVVLATTFAIVGTASADALRQLSIRLSSASQGTAAPRIAK
jgi:hypothetical protein